MRSVGSASVAVVPDATGFQSRLDAQLRNLKATVNVVLQDSGIREQLDELTKDRTATISADIDDALAKAKLEAFTALISGHTATIGIDLDDAAVKEKLAELTALTSGRTAKIETEVDTSAAEAKLAEVSHDRSETIKVDADTDSATAKIDEMIASVVKQQVAEIVVDANTQFAQAKVDDLRAQMQDATIKLDVDTSRAQAQISAIQAEIAQVKARIAVDVDDTGAKARLEALQHELATIQAKVDADTAPAKAKIAALRAEISSRSESIKVDANTSGAEAQVTALGGSADTAGGRFAGLIAAAAAIAPAIIPVAAAAAGAVLGIGSAAVISAAGIGVLVLGLAGVVSAVAAVTKAQASSGAEAAQNAAAQVAAAQRIQSAQTGLKSAEASLANTRASAADAARRAAESVVQAQQGIQTATEQAAQSVATATERVAASQRAVQQAQQGVQSAIQQAAQGVQQAIGQEAGAERSLQSALQSETDAQQALSAARKQAKQDLEDLTNSVADGALAQRQSAIDIQTTKDALTQLGPTQTQVEQAVARTAAAQDRYAKLAANPAATQAQKATAKATLDAATAQQQALQQAIGGTTLQRQQAQLNYDQAVQHQKDLATQQSRLVQQQKDAQHAGVSGAPGVQSAQQNLTQAQQNVKDAQNAVTAAQQAITQARVTGDQQIAKAEQSLADAQQTAADDQKALAQARVDGARQINQAEQQLADAEAARTSQQRQSAFSISQAQQQVINSQQSLQDAYAKTGTTASSSSSAAQQALAKLTPEGRKLVNFITGTLIPGFHSLGNIAQEQISGGALAGLEAMKPLVPVMKGIVGDLSSALGGLLEQAGKALGSPFWVNFFQMIRSTAGPTVKALGTIIGNVLTGFAGMIETFAPIGQQMLDWLERLTGKFKNFGTGKTSGLGKFFDYVQQVGPLVVGTIGSLFKAAGHILVAFAPWGTTILGWIKGIADWISRIPASTLRDVAKYAGEVFLAMKGWNALSGIVGGVAGAISGLASPVGLIAAAVGLAAAGMILLYQNSKPFRDFVNNELVPVLKDAAEWVGKHLLGALSDLWGFIQQYVVPLLIDLGRNALAGVRDAVGEVAKSIKRNRPELQLLWSAFKKVADFIFQHVLPLLGPLLKAAIQVLGDQISFAIDVIGGLVDIYVALGKGVAKAYDAVKSSAEKIGTAIGDSIGTAKSSMKGWIDWIKGTFNDGVHWLYDHLIKPVFDTISAAATTLFGKNGAVRSTLDGWVSWVKDSLSGGVTWLYDHLFKDVFNEIHDAAVTLLGKGGKLRTVFSDAVTALGAIWKGLEAVAKAPISFMINTVLDKGLIPAYNWVAGVLPGVKAIKPVHIPGFDTGGVLPGYTPGRDVHRFYSQTGGALDLSGGEAIMRPEWTRAVGGEKAVAAMNAAAIAGRFAGGGVFRGSGLVNFDGGTFTAQFAKVVRELAKLVPGFHLYQGGWNPGGVSASGHTHDKDALDYGPPNRANETIGRRLGLAAFLRDAATGWTQTIAHIHAVPSPSLGDGSPSARAQYQNYLDGFNGLAGNGRDTGNRSFVGKGGVASGGGGGGAAGLLDFVAGLQKRLADPLAKLKTLGSSPWAKLVEEAPRALATKMLDSVKNLAGDVISGVAGAVSTGSNKARALALMPAYGFNPVTQWSSLDKLWSRESGWSKTARNPQSGAYGIAQAYPASLMSTVGSDWLTNPTTQIKWGLEYIKGRYGSPSAAWAHELADNWYDAGGWLQPGTTIVHNDTGKPEPVLSPSQWAAFTAAANRPPAQFNFNVHDNPVTDEQQLVRQMRTSFGDAMSLNGMGIGALA